VNLVNYIYRIGQDFLLRPNLNGTFTFGEKIQRAVNTSKHRIQTESINRDGTKIIVTNYVYPIKLDLRTDALSIFWRIKSNYEKYRSIPKDDLEHLPASKNIIEITTGSEILDNCCFNLIELNNDNFKYLPIGLKSSEKQYEIIYSNVTGRNIVDLRLKEEKYLFDVKKLEEKILFHFIRNKESIESTKIILDKIITPVRYEKPFKGQTWDINYDRINIDLKD
jgi:hypothetical protein